MPVGETELKILQFSSKTDTLPALEAQTEVGELRREIEALREKVQQAENVKES